MSRFFFDPRFLAFLVGINFAFVGVNLSNADFGRAAASTAGALIFGFMTFADSPPPERETT